MSVRKPMKDSSPAKGHTQNFNGAGQHIIKPSHAPMPMHNPQTMKMAMGNTFEGMPAYPNQYICEGISTPHPRVTKVFKNE